MKLFVIVQMMYRVSHINHLYSVQSFITLASLEQTVAVLRSSGYQLSFENKKPRIMYSTSISEKIGLEH